MKTRHTPGPWYIGTRQPSSDKFIYGPQGSEVADCDRLLNSPGENLANARLIAAAPELLAHLHSCQRILEEAKDVLDKLGKGGLAAVCASEAEQIRAALGKHGGAA